jgi:type I restriction enzyme S subunit
MIEYNLGDLIKIHHGRNYTHLNRGYIPVYGTGGIMCYVDEYLYEGKAILLPRKGSLSNIMYSLGKIWTVDTMYYASVSEDVVNPYYLYRYLLLLDLSHLDSGSTLPSMTQSSYAAIKIKLPNIKIQNKIAKILSNLDAKIELNNRINKKLEAMAKTLYDYWFVQFDFPDANGKPYKSSGGKMVYNKELKREIPEDWENGYISHFSEMKSGFAFKSTWWEKSGIPVLKITNIREDGTVSFNNCSFVSGDKAKKAKNSIAKGGDIVIAMTGATIGKFAIIPDFNKAILINQRVGLFNLGNKPYEKLPFLINSLRQKYIRENIFSISSGCAQPNISSEGINNLELIKPRKEIVDKFNYKMKPFYKKIIINQKQSQDLTNLRDFLLPMLMNGQVSVK